jgi:hypothetical protein
LDVSSPRASLGWLSLFSGLSTFIMSSGDVVESLNVLNADVEEEESLSVLTAVEEEDESLSVLKVEDVKEEEVSPKP